MHINAAALTARGVKLGPDTRHLIEELKAGRPVRLPGAPMSTPHIDPSEVMVAGTRGRRVAVFSDMSALSSPARALAAGVDLLVHEATHMPGDCAKARLRGHSTPDMAGTVAAAVGARSLVLTHFGRAALDRERSSAMWALGLDEAQAENSRREAKSFASTAGGATGGAPRARRSPANLQHNMAWCGVHARVSGIFENPAMLNTITAGTALDFSFPKVSDVGGVWLPAPPGGLKTFLPGPSDWASAAVAAHRSALAAAAERKSPYPLSAPTAPSPLPVLCARDFMSVIVQPPGQIPWGMAGVIGGDSGDQKNRGGGGGAKL